MSIDRVLDVVMNLCVAAALCVFTVWAIAMLALVADDAIERPTHTMVCDVGQHLVVTKKTLNERIVPMGTRYTFTCEIGDDL